MKGLLVMDKHAVQFFNADKTYLLNGTSSSNKVVTNVLLVALETWFYLTVINDKLFIMVLVLLSNTNYLENSS